MKRKKQIKERILPLYERVKCSCGRSPVGLTQCGYAVCSVHNSFPTKKVYELNWNRVPEVSQTIYAPACPYCGKMTCNCNYE